MDRGAGAHLSGRGTLVGRPLPVDPDAVTAPLAIPDLAIPEQRRGATPVGPRHTPGASTDGRRPAARGKRVLGAVVVTAALAMLAGALWWLVSLQTGNEAAPTVPAAPVSTSPAAVAAPVLGRSSESGDGLGVARPRTVNFGGDVTTIVRDITWQSWGPAQARGTGRAIWSGGGPLTDDRIDNPEPVVVVASALGSCGGKPAYRSVVWYFPRHGQTAPSGSATAVCS